MNIINMLRNNIPLEIGPGTDFSDREEKKRCQNGMLLW